MCLHFWLFRVFVAAGALLVVVASRGFFAVAVGGASLWGGFSRGGAWALRREGSVEVARGLSSCGPRALERAFGSNATQASLPQGVWDHPGSGFEPIFSYIDRRVFYHWASREAFCIFLWLLLSRFSRVRHCVTP